MAKLRPDRKSATLVLFLVLIVSDLASSEDNKCRTGCRGAPKTFKYAEGTTYKYNLEGNIDISLSSVEGQQSKTKLKATVFLTQLPECNQILKLKDVQIIGPDAKKYGRLAGVEKPIKINFHDGHIEDVICTEQNDNQNSLNIKRAVASLFQVVKHDHETDVFGVCPTDVDVRENGNTVVIHKSKNLNKCGHRESISNELLTTTFNLNSEIKSSPLLNGDYSSEQYVKNGILEKAIVTENYLFIPFSVGKNGAQATVSTKIQFVGQSKENPTTKANEPKSIIFDNPHPVSNEKVNVDSIISALKAAKSTIDQTVSDSTAAEFLNLVKTLRVSLKNDILSVYHQVKNGAGFPDKVGTKKMFLDALFRAGTGETIEVAIELFKKNELSPLEQKILFVRLALVGHATPGSLLAAGNLVDQANLPREAYLSIGSIAGTYCRQHSCVKNDAVNKLTQKLLAKVKGGKPQNREQEKEQLYALKALGNIGFLNDAATSRLISIAQDKKEPNRIRIAALETLSTDSCKDKIRDAALSILKDIQQDSEIRIKAYLILAQCPNGKVATAVKNLLDNELSYQVGGFIASHIRNLKASTNPDKELAKQQLGNIKITKKFPIDLRKYSFNAEFSYAIDTLGMANSIESNVIYSQRSFLPRSMNLNLTADLFGHTLNFLELSSRQENLDKVLEHYFGPLGVFKSSEPEELFTEGKKEATSIYEKVQSRLSKLYRSKRDIPQSEVDKIEKDIRIKTNEMNNDLDLDYSVKLFGSELLFLNIHEDVNTFKPEALIEKFFNGLEAGIDKTKQFQESIQTNVVFLDTELSYPTSLGFPLRLAAEGTSSILVNVEGNIDVKALANNAPEQQMRLKVIPSANIEISGSLYIDAQVVEGGLKVKTTMHTATGTDLAISFSKVKGLDAKFSLPVKNQKIISASHQILFTSRELGKGEIANPLKFSHNKDFEICYDQLSPFVGLAFCADIDGPSQTGKQAPLLPFPFSGNAMFNVSIEREDLSQFHLKTTNHADGVKQGFEFVFEVLGEKMNKKLSVEAEASIRPEIFVRGEIKAPTTLVAAEGRLILEPNERSIMAKVQMNQQNYFAKLGFALSRAKQREIYKPILEYELPQLPGVSGQEHSKLEGTISVERIGSKVHYVLNDVKLVVPKQKSFSLKGQATTEGPAYDFDLTASDGNQDASLKGNLVVIPDLKLDVEFKNSVNPQANVHLILGAKKDPHGSEGLIELTHGHDLNSKINKLLISGGTHYDVENSDKYKMKSTGKFSYPVIATEASYELECKPKSFKYDVNLKYQKVEFGSELEFEVNRKTTGDYDLEFEVHGMGNKVEIKSERNIDGDKSKIENEVEINGQKAELKGTVTHHLRSNDIDVGADLVIKVPKVSDPIKFDSKLVLNPDKLNTHLKIKAGPQIDVNMALNANRDGNANGDLKAVIKDFINVQGQLKATKGSGNARLEADVTKVNKKLKLDSTFKIDDPVYQILVNIYPDVNKDPQNKIILSSNNKIAINSIDTNNFVEVMGKKLEVNAKASMEGKPSESEKRNIDVEITLPTDHYFSLKLRRDLKFDKDVVNGNGLFFIEQRDNKNLPGRKFTSKGTLKDTNLRKRILDYTNNLELDLGRGKTINAEVNIKHAKGADENHHSQFGLKASGSLLENSLEISTSANYKNLEGNYKINGKYGQKSNVAINGKYDLQGKGKPFSGDINIDATTPNAVIRTIKLTSSGSAKTPESLDDYLDLNGQFVLFVDDDGSKPDATIDIKASGEVRASRKDGKLMGDLRIQKESPLLASLGYGISDGPESKKLNANLELKTGKGRDVKTDLTIAKPTENEYIIDLFLDAPEARGSKFHFYTKKSPDGKSHQNRGTVEVNGKKYVIANDLVLSETTPVLDLSLEFPDGNKDQITFKLNRISPHKGSGEVKIAFPRKEFLLEGNIDATVESLDDFNVKASLNSPSLKINKYSLEAQTKTTKGANRIMVSLTSDGQNVVSGSYKHRTEGDKVIIEGAGQFKVKEENKAANFKYIRQYLNNDRSGEQGVLISFNGGLGPKAVDSELKITNKQFKILNSYCEDKKSCSHIEVDSKITNDDVASFYHEIELALDLRNLGFPHEFGLKGVTKRKDFVFIHTVDVYVQNKNNKYQYSVNVDPTEAGVSLTTPKRVVAAEAKLQMPKKKGIFSPIKGDISLYFDKKNQPNQKTSLSGEISYDHGENSGSFKSELTFTNPTLSKNLQFKYSSKYDLPSKTASFEIVLDPFQKESQKIVITSNGVVKRTGNYGYASDVVSTIKSDGLKIDIKAHEKILFDIFEKKSLQYSYDVDYNVEKSKYSSGLKLEADEKHILVGMNAFNKQLVKIDSRFQFSTDSQNIDTNVELLGVKPLTSHLSAKNFNTLHYTVSRKETPNDKLELNAGLIPNQISDLRLEVVKAGSRKDLLHATVKLDEANFLKSDYGINSQNIRQYIFASVKNDMETFLKEVKSFFDVVTKDVSNQINYINEIAKKNTPYLKPFVEYHKNELQKLREEFVSDKTLREFEEILKNTFGAAVQTLNEVFTQLNEITEKLTSSLRNSFEVIIESINRDMVPKLKEIAKSVFDLTYAVIEEGTNLLFTYLTKMSQILEAHQAELKQVASYITSINQDLIQFLSKVFHQIQEVVEKESDKIIKEIKNLPIAEQLKGKYNELTSGLPISEGLANTLKDIILIVKDVLPNEKMREVITAFGNYVDKKLRHQSVDDIAAIRNIIKTFVEAVKEILKGFEDGKNINLPKTIPFSLNLLKNLPRLVEMKFSPLNYFLRNDIPDLATGIRNSISLNPRDYFLPQRLFGIVAQGQHIFTFDGRHLTFPGKCNYLLAGDAENGNFTLIGTYNNGILSAITLAVGKDVVTLKQGGKVLLNNAPSNFPVITKNVEAYVKTVSVHLASKSGVKVNCGTDLLVCGVHISGFYHGQLKGLLGNGNNEPFDDLTLPNGKIVTSEDEFANSYKTSSSCANVKVVDHSGHKNHNDYPSCQKLFSSESPLKLCTAFVDPKNFKEACVHGLENKVANTEKAIAVAYAAACNHKYVPTHIPDEFIKCENGDKPYDLFTKFSVKVPNKAADILFVVDQSKENEEIYKEILQPLVPQLSQELTSKGFNDIEFHLMSYNGANPDWPAHFTQDGKWTFKGKLPNLKFYKHEEKTAPSVGHPKIDAILKEIKDILHDLSLATGHNLEAFTYREAITYPFRVNAAKAIVVARGTSCETGRFAALQKLRALLFRNEQISLNVIAPLENIKVRHSKDAKNIVGFNERNAFTVSDSKTKQGSADLRRNLDYDDYCTDFTLNQRGNVFLSNNILSAKAGGKKTAIQIAAHNIIHSMTNVEQGLDCECKPISPYSAVNKCHVAYSKELPTKGGVKG